MPELTFSVEGAEAERFAAAPLIHLRVRVGCHDNAVRIRNVMLQCQVRIEPARRRYTAAEQAELVDLFGEPSRWSRTLQGLLWTHASVLVPAFEESCVVSLPVPCTFDFNVAATKYFHGLSGGEVPLLLLFSGTVFYDEGTGLQIGQIAWTKESRFALPVSVWQSMMAHYYPDSAWLRLPHGVFERLRRYRQQHGLSDWEQAIDHLLAAQPQAEEAR
ncbi:MAG: hypothetical protein H0X13_19185 [Ramlibacter sp.]|nr:hypothetical protein [Ramlibacter sp.]